MSFISARSGGFAALEVTASRRHQRRQEETTASHVIGAGLMDIPYEPLEVVQLCGHIQRSGPPDVDGSFSSSRA
jgi:hypothetical protein